MPSFPPMATTSLIPAVCTAQSGKKATGVFFGCLAEDGLHHDMAWNVNPPFPSISMRVFRFFMDGLFLYIATLIQPTAQQCLPTFFALRPLNRVTR